MNNKRTSSKTIAVSAVTICLMIALSPLPFVFLIPLIFTCCTRGFKMSAFMGLCFGVISYLYALMGGSIVAVAFIEAPYIAIIPRIFVGIIGYLTFTGTNKLLNGTLKKQNNKTTNNETPKTHSKIKLVLPYIFAAIAASLSNTLLVVGCFYLFMPNLSFGDVVMYAYIPMMLLSGLIEIAVTAVIIPPLSITVSKALKLKPISISSTNKNSIDKNSENTNQNSTNINLVSSTQINIDSTNIKTKEHTA